MTTVAEEKQRREEELKNAPNMVVLTRLKVIEAVQLAMEMKSLTDLGLSIPYHKMAIFYGKQRAILRGLTAGDVMHFNLPDGETWNQSPGFTFPSLTRFGYSYFDNEGNPASIDDASLYYLTKKTDSRVLSTMEDDSNAFVAPIPLKDQQQNIVTWGATVFYMNLSQSPQPGTIKLLLNNDQLALDDGSGNITGTGISGTIDYQTQVVNLTFENPVSQSELLYIVYDTNTDPVIAAIYERIDVKTHSLNYQCSLTKKVIPGTLKIQIEKEDAAVDDGVGNIAGESINGTISYQNQILQLNFSNPDDRFKLITLVHDSIINQDVFDESYSQLDFTLNTKSYLSTHTLNLIDVAAGELDQCPVLTSSTLLRRKLDHQVVGTIKVICEGMETNSLWNHLNGNPEETTVLTHAEFKSLLGFLDMDLVNPGNNNDLQNSSNSYLSSSGRKVGSDYPDIEKNPFWPCTDGTYLGAMIYKGHFVHWEEVPVAEDQSKWSTHSDIKWQYGTRPDGYDPVTFATDGDFIQHDPVSVITALQKIVDFVGSDPIAVPIDSGSALTGGTDYDMVGDYVYKYPYEDDDEGGYKKGAGVVFTCYHNDVQHLIDEHLNHLQTQCHLIIALENIANSIEPDRQSPDTQFFNEATTFCNTLDAFISYHIGFDPLSRSDYDTPQMTILKTATEPGGFLEQVVSRLTYLNTVLGDPETAGSYSKIIYDACNYAANKEIGYLRDVIDKLNSIQDIYDMIAQKQQQYGMYHDISP